ncbi:MAG: hypothetical protein MUC83_09310, partial [Pirellula sp.]|nr:hypothetical protein [Pirellula sp.]
SVDWWFSSPSLRSSESITDTRFRFREKSISSVFLLLIGKARLEIEPKLRDSVKQALLAMNGR